MKLSVEWKRMIEEALKEDRCEYDITSSSIIPPGVKARAALFSRDKGVLAGLNLAAGVFTFPPSDIIFTPLLQDGNEVKKDQEIAYVEGSANTIITRERVALNFLQHLSGIATLTQEFVKRARNVKILDTRKTIPTLRSLQKYAVRMGGGFNHRMNLSEMVLIKDNHIAVAGNITQAIRDARKNTDKPIEVEVKSISELKEALKLKPDRIMLDNMDMNLIRQAIEIINGRTEVEISGNVSLQNIGDLADLKINYISVGRLTHSAPALDISLEILHVQRS